MKWRDWFKKRSERTVWANVFGDSTVTTLRVTETEEMYQAFKARLLDELYATTEHGDRVIIEPNETPYDDV